MDDKKKIIEEAQKNGITIRGNMGKIFPVLRHPSFLKKHENDFISREHTAESIILFVMEMPFGFIFISREKIMEEGIEEEEIYNWALSNLQRLDLSYKTDRLGENIFYFFAKEDLFSASRILNPTLLNDMRKIVKGQMGVAIPHQDVLIIADLANGKGASALSQVAFDFAMKGEVPITPLPFMVENGTLEPFLVVHHTKSRHKKN